MQLKTVLNRRNTSKQIQIQSILLKEIKLLYCHAYVELRCKATAAVIASHHIPVEHN